jgi:hypothetical protein
MSRKVGAKQIKSKKILFGDGENGIGGLVRTSREQEGGGDQRHGDDGVDAGYGGGGGRRPIPLLPAPSHSIPLLPSPSHSIPIRAAALLATRAHHILAAGSPAHRVVLDVQLRLG